MGNLVGGVIALVIGAVVGSATVVGVVQTASPAPTQSDTQVINYGSK